MDNSEPINSITRISLASDGTESNGYSGSNSISDNGRYIPFSSNATNLVPNDTNNYVDTFIYDRIEQTVELISLAPDGTQANNSSSSGSISGNGRYVTFASFATNLVANDTNAKRDIFIYDRVAKTTELISTAPNAAIANDDSYFSVINDNGRYVAFESDADNLVANDNNGQRDIFIRDRVEQTTELVSVNSDGTQANGFSELGSISDDGRYIVFESDADNLVANDNNGQRDIFIRDRVEQTTELVSVSSSGTQANGVSEYSSISGNGRYVIFESDANNLVANDTNKKRDIFVYDRVEQTTELVSMSGDGTIGNLDSSNPSISDDGRYIAFLSDANNLVTDDTNQRSDIFIYDRVEKTTTRTEADSFASISGNGQYVVFNSGLDDLVFEDTNEAGDVFAIDLNELVGGFGMNRFNTDEVHRFYQYEKGFHFYTTDDVEIDYVIEKSLAGELSYQYEEEKFRVLADDKDALTGATLEGVDAVYRFFNTETGVHLYTTDEVERAFIEENLPNYSPEGIKYYAFESKPEGIETIPVFRMLNTDTGSHLYTIEQSELNYIQDNLPNFSLENNGEATFHVFEL